MKHILARAVMVLVAATTLAACGDDEPPATVSGPMAELYQQARNEPPLTWYSSQDPALNEALVTAFGKAFPGLQVQQLRLASGALATRYAQEHNAGAKTADVLTASAQAFLKDGFTKGWFEQIDKTSLPAVAKLDDKWFINGGEATAAISLFGICYNTNLVKNPPKDWTDALDPQYKGKIAFADFRNAPLYLDQGALWIDNYGEQYLRDLKAQSLKVVDSMVPGVQQLAAGQLSLAVPCPPTIIESLKNDGAPIAVTFPPKVVGAEFDSVITKGTRSPSFAKLFYDFMFTPEGQAAINGKTGASALGAPGTTPLPAGYTRPIVDKQPATLKTMQDIFQLA
ncbi:extracellular solute-binding protein [Dactylosporangium sp. CA-152071]|uniref:extracellular solute-binding protein n=1 Tax=Dactylosporangium sp. CA-152071 TaxID=3239933 RepID=UPI003D9266F9